MKFLVALVAIFGYASASWLAPSGLGWINQGDAQAVAIDTNAALRDRVRTVGEINQRAAEWNRDIHQSAYWGNVAANQNVVAALQGQAAGLSGAWAANAGLAARVNPWAASPWGVAGVGAWGAHGAW